MKKFLMMVAVAMMTAVSANAQSESNMWVKPMVGGTLATVTKVNDTKMKFGLVAGAEFGYHVIEPLAITGGLLVSMQGTKAKDNPAMKDFSWTTTYLNIPIMANYYIVKGLAVKAGIQPGFLLGSKVKYKVNEGMGWIDFESTSTDNMKKFDLSIPMGLSYEIADFVIDARYNLGVLKIAKDSEKMVDGDAKNSVIMLTVGYKIPL
jgi:hypothetical protein